MLASLIKYPAHCCGQPDITAFGGKSSEKMESLLLEMAKYLHDGDDVPDIYQDLYFAYADLFKKGIADGYGTSIKIDYDSPDNQMLSYMKMNVHVFSGAKSLAELRDMRSLLTGTDGKTMSWPDFKKSVLQLHQDYNVVQLQAEYDNAVASSQMAAQWQRIQSQKHLFPYLRYRTAGDSRVRPQHAALDGILLPVDDPMWDSIYPPNGWRCRCSVGQESSSQGLSDSNTVGRMARGMFADPYFKQNVGKTGVIFSPEHPYLKGQDVNKWDAVKTYGMKKPSEINDRIPASRQPDEFTDFNSWRSDLMHSLKDKQVKGTNNYVIQSKIGDQVVIKPSFLDHMEEQKQLDEERWRIMKELENVLTDPDEVWIRSADYGNMDEFGTTYIKYFHNRALVMATQSNRSNPGLIQLKTGYTSDISNDTAGGNDQIGAKRKGVLMYRK